MHGTTIPKRTMIDIHMHLMPGVDDGAENMEMALVMVHQAREQGIRHIFVTPHNGYFHYERKGTAENRFRKLEAAVGAVCPDVKLYLGCELYCDSYKMETNLEGLSLGCYPTMNGTNYVLTEYSPWTRPMDIFGCVDELVEAGYIPIIAHLERYQEIWGNMEIVDQYRRQGAKVQINAYSLFDEMDENIKNWARRLVQERKADFLGTDAHRTYHRPPSAACGLNWLYENVEQDYADDLAWGNAQLLLLTK